MTGQRPNQSIRSASGAWWEGDVLRDELSAHPPNRRIKSIMHTCHTTSDSEPSHQNKLSFKDHSHSRSFSIVISQLQPGHGPSWTQPFCSWTRGGGVDWRRVVRPNDRALTVSGPPPPCVQDVVGIEVAFLKTQFQ